MPVVNYSILDKFDTKFVTKFCLLPIVLTIVTTMYNVMFLLCFSLDVLFLYPIWNFFLNLPLVILYRRLFIRVLIYDM